MNRVYIFPRNYLCFAKFNISSETAKINPIEIRLIFTESLKIKKNFIHKFVIIY